MSTAEADNVRLADHLAEFLDLLEGKEAARKLVKSRSVDLQQKLTAAERELSQLKATLPAQVTSPPVLACHLCSLFGSALSVAIEACILPGCSAASQEDILLRL